LFRQQLSSLVYEKTNSSTEEAKLIFPSGNVDYDDFYDAKLSAQIKRNEELMVHLQIPGQLHNHIIFFYYDTMIL